MTKRLQIGEIVHYVPMSGNCQPAIVVPPFADDSGANLCAFSLSGAMPLLCVLHSTERAPHTWHYCTERAPDNQPED